MPTWGSPGVVGGQRGSGPMFPELCSAMLAGNPGPCGTPLPGSESMTFERLLCGLYVEVDRRWTGEPE